MSPENPQNQNPDLEARLTALLLGELTGAESAALQQSIEQNPQLAAQYERLKSTIGLVKEAVGPVIEAGSGETEEPMRLSAERREKLLAHFKTVKPKEFERVKMRKPWPASAIVSVAAVLALLGGLAYMLMPRLASSGRSNPFAAVRRQPPLTSIPPSSWAIKDSLRGYYRDQEGRSAGATPVQNEPKNAAHAGVSEEEARNIATVLSDEEKVPTPPPIVMAGEQVQTIVLPETKGKEADDTAAQGMRDRGARFGGLTPGSPVPIGNGTAHGGGGGTGVEKNNNWSFGGVGGGVAQPPVSQAATALGVEPQVQQAPGQQTLAYYATTPESARRELSEGKPVAAAGGILAGEAADSLGRSQSEAVQDHFFAGNDFQVQPNLGPAQSAQKQELANRGLSLDAAAIGDGDFNGGNLAAGVDDAKKVGSRQNATITGNSDVAFTTPQTPPTELALADTPALGSLFRAKLSPEKPAAVPAASMPAVVPPPVTTSASPAPAVDSYAGFKLDDLSEMRKTPAANEAKLESYKRGNIEITRDDVGGLRKPESVAKEDGFNLNAVHLELAKESYDEPSLKPQLSGGNRKEIELLSDGTVAGRTVVPGDKVKAAAANSLSFAFTPTPIAPAEAGKSLEDLPELKSQLGNSQKADGEDKAGARGERIARRYAAAPARPAAPPPVVDFGLASASPHGLAADGAVNVTNSGRIETLNKRVAGAPIEGDVALQRQPVPPPMPLPEVQTAENRFSTFSLNVADVSFKLAAASLEKGAMPDVTSIRSEEFLNAFNYRDPDPGPGAPIGFAWERARSPFAHNRELIRFAVKTAAAGRASGQPLNLVLLLDNSGSMERSDRVQIIHEALRVLAAQLHPNDTLSVVTFARKARLWVDGVAGNQAGTVFAQVDGLTPEGGTNLEEAMNLAYATAQRHYLMHGLNRVVLLTDGAANLGDVNPSALKEKVEMNRKQGIALDCFGIGWEGYNDDLLEVLSRNGDGRYGFINSPEEAAAGFASQLAGALKVAASDVKVQVEFNPSRVTVYRQIGYAKHQLTKEQFRDNTVDAAEIGAAESGNAMYVTEVNPNGSGPIGVVRVRYKVPGTTEYHEQEWPLSYTGNAVRLEESSPAMRLASVASVFAEWLASSPYTEGITTKQLRNLMDGVPAVYGVDPRPKQLEQMIREAGGISGK